MRLSLSISTPGRQSNSGYSAGTTKGFPIFNCELSIVSNRKSTIGNWQSTRIIPASLSTLCLRLCLPPVYEIRSSALGRDFGDQGRHECGWKYRQRISCSRPSSNQFASLNQVDCEIL